MFIKKGKKGKRKERKINQKWKRARGK